MSLIASIYLTILASSAPAATEPVSGAPAATPTATAAAVEADSVVICKRFPAPTGSRIGKRQICKTKWQWDQEKAENAEAMDKVQRNPGKPTG